MHEMLTEPGVGSGLFSCCFDILSHLIVNTTPFAVQLRLHMSQLANWPKTEMHATAKTRSAQAE